LWYCCIPPWEMHFVLVFRCMSYDACEMWNSVDLDAGSNFCEFSHILAGSRMQPLMTAKSWLDLGCGRQAGSRLLLGWPMYQLRELIKARYKHWPLSNGLQLEHLLQTCQQSNGQRKSPLPIRGPFVKTLETQVHNTHLWYWFYSNGLCFGAHYQSSLWAQTNNHFHVTGG
jgi:hypothetical protein